MADIRDELLKDPDYDPEKLISELVGSHIVYESYLPTDKEDAVHLL